MSIVTLRGAIDVTLGKDTSFGASEEKQIFEYESPDRTRGWRIRYAAFWVQQGISSTLGGDNRLMIQSTLSTDSLGAVTITDGATAKEWTQRMGAGDNRTMACLSQDYQNRENTNADFITPGQGWGREMIVDFDRIITNELWLQTYAVTEGDEGDVVCNYYIELEQIKISASQSVFQQLKGIGQDIDS